MRIKIRLRAPRAPFYLPYNYQPLLQAVVYKIIARADKDYATKLHETGYWNIEDGKHYKMFVFSDLMLGKRYSKPDCLKVVNEQITWYISSPMEEFLQNIVNGFFKQGSIQIGEIRFDIETIETLAEPDFTSKMTFKCLSPVTVSTQIEKDGKLLLYYIRPHEHEAFSAAVKQNLINKYQRVHGKKPDDNKISFQFDAGYIERKGNRVSRLVTIKSGQKGETKIKGFTAPFTVTGSPELIKVGYEAGFGARNSLGFGMAEVILD